MSTKKVPRSHDEQCMVVPGQYFIFHYLCIPLFPLGFVWSQISGVLDLAPVAWRASHQQPNAALAGMFHVGLAHCFVEPSIYGRDRFSVRHHVAPCLLNLIERDILAGNIAIDSLLIKCISEFHNDVVHLTRESRRLYQLAEPLVLLFAVVDFAKHHDIVRLKRLNHSAGGILQLRLSGRSRILIRPSTGFELALEIVRSAAWPFASTFAFMAK